MKIYRPFSSKEAYAYEAPTLIEVAVSVSDTTGTWEKKVWLPLKTKISLKAPPKILLPGITS